MKDILYININMFDPGKKASEANPESKGAKTA